MKHMTRKATPRQSERGIDLREIFGGQSRVENGPDGLRQTTEDAVLNANYIGKGLEGTYDLPYATPTMHEVVFSDRLQAKKGVRTMDIAKRSSTMASIPTPPRFR